jgi:hypothetical protein
MFEQQVDEGQTDSESKFDAATQQLLDQAAEHGYEHHEGSMDYPESAPGEFWSIRVENCHRRAGAVRNREERPDQASDRADVP